YANLISDGFRDLQCSRSRAMRDFQDFPIPQDQPTLAPAAVRLVLSIRVVVATTRWVNASPPLAYSLTGNAFGAAACDGVVSSANATEGGNSTMEFAE